MPESSTSTRPTSSTSAETSRARSPDVVTRSRTRKATSLPNAVRAVAEGRSRRGQAARAAWPKWAAATAYNRGQVLYRVAEMMESRRAICSSELRRPKAARRSEAGRRAIDTWVWYAGLADKLAQITGNLNPVAGPYFNITSPEPTGVVGIVAPERPSLSGPRAPDRARSSVEGTPPWCSRPSLTRCPRSPWPSVSRRRTSPAAS